MNTTNKFVNRTEDAIGKFALMALCAIGLMTAIAAQQPASADDAQATKIAHGGSRTQHVSMTGLDLSTPEGMRAARIRVREAARKLCSQVADMDDLSHHANYVACMEESMTVALQQIRPPSLVAAAKTPGRDSR